MPGRLGHDRVRTYFSTDMIVSGLANASCDMGGRGGTVLSTWRCLPPQAEFGGAVRQPMPKSSGKAAEHGDLIGGRFVELPEDDAQMRAGGHRRIAGAERRRVQVDGEPLLE